MGPVSPCTTWSVSPCCDLICRKMLRCGSSVITLIFFCVQADKVEEIRSYVHSGIAKAILYQCNCSFSAEFIRNGLFRCWNALNEFTYRSKIVGMEGHNATDLVGMEGHNATELVGLLQQWVYSEPTLQVDQFELWVGTRCPVALSSLKLKGEGKCL